MFTMNPPRLDLDVPEGWSCWMELTRTPDGSYSGVADLALRGVHRCYLVITRQRSRDEAVQRATVRADHYVRQWPPQPSASARKESLTLRN